MARNGLCTGLTLAISEPGRHPDGTGDYHHQFGIDLVIFGIDLVIGGVRAMASHGAESHDEGG